MQALAPQTHFSLYIHLPWCIQKCPYCDFNSHTLPKQIHHSHLQNISTLPAHNIATEIQDHYIARLIADFKSHLSTIKGRKLVSIFIGGGTPSLFSADHIAHLLTNIHQLHPFEDTIEITLEANPGAIEAQRFKGYRAAGINRLSLGIQSLSDTKLKALGRIHNAHHAKQAIHFTQDAGFDNFNIDIMFALPTQSIEEALTDLQQALAFKPPHLSWYQLTLEPRTVFHKYPPPLPDDDSIADMQQAGIKLLAEQGLRRYEISAFSQANQQCIHNRHYWEFGDYLGIGAGAHSKITDNDTGDIYRFVKRKHPQQYLDNKLTMTAQHHLVPDADRLLEFMLNALRLCEPISNDLCYARTAMHLSAAADKLQQAQQQGLLHWTPQSLSLTELGRRFLNDVTALFL